MLSNATSRRVVVDRVETSCGCIQVVPKSFEVEGGKSVDLSISFDPHESPEFRGNLRVEVIGRGPADRVAFKTIIDVAIEDRPATGGGNDHASTGKE